MDKIAENVSILNSQIMQVKKLLDILVTKLKATTRYSIIFKIIENVVDKNKRTFVNYSVMTYLINVPLKYDNYFDEIKQRLSKFVKVAEDSNIKPERQTLILNQTFDATNALADHYNIIYQYLNSNEMQKMVKKRENIEKELNLLYFMWMRNRNNEQFQWKFANEKIDLLFDLSTIAMKDFELAHGLYKLIQNYIYEIKNYSDNLSRLLNNEINEMIPKK